MNLKKFVHIDMKGGAVKLDYLRNLVKFLKPLGCEGLLLEYEDMFPYTDSLKILSRSDAYKPDDLRDFLNFCLTENIKVIPLVQTFGHMEFVLKHEGLRYLRENFKFPMTICPSIADTLNLIKEMIGQIVKFHENLSYLHVGGDEVFDFNVCQNCKMRDLDKARLFIQHMMNVCLYVKKELALQPIIWDDMLREIDMNLIISVQLHTTVELMIWNYVPLLNLSDEYLTRIVSTFPRVWAASAFKGGNGATKQIVDTSVYVKNNQSWIEKIKYINKLGRGQFIGMVLTGWSRFDHFASLCELLPAAVPCLSMCLQIISTGAFTAELHERVSKSLGFPELIPWEPIIKCVNPSVRLDFPGYEVYQAISGWYLLKSECIQILNSEIMDGWLSKTHRKRVYGNYATVEVIVNQLEDLLKRFVDWKSIFETNFRAILLESTADEWFEVHMSNTIDKLRKRIRQGQQIIAIGDSVLKKNVLEAGDC